MLLPFAYSHENIGPVQPHGFFNCSPAVDIPPSTNDNLDHKDNNGIVAKPIQNGLPAKL